MRYIVIATRPNHKMVMGWDNEEEQLSCAGLYASQGWDVTLEFNGGDALSEPGRTHDMAEDAGLPFASLIFNPYNTPEA